MKSRVAQVKPVEGKKAEKSAAQPATANDEPTPPDDSEEVPF
jgi:hypothetical protein